MMVPERVKSSVVNMAKLMNLVSLKSLEYKHGFRST
jgi:hypothetical protein